MMLNQKRNQSHYDIRQLYYARVIMNCSLTFYSYNRNCLVYDLHDNPFSKFNSTTDGCTTVYIHELITTFH